MNMVEVYKVWEMNPVGPFQVLDTTRDNKELFVSKVRQQAETYAEQLNEAYQAGSKHAYPIGFKNGKHCAHKETDHWRTGVEI